MSGAYPAVFPDLRWGDRLCLFSRSVAEMDRLYAAFSREGADQLEKAIFFSSKQVEQKGLANLENFYQVMSDEAAAAITEGCIGLRVFLQADRIMAGWLSEGVLEERLDAFDGWAKEHSCSSIWCLLMGEVDEWLLNAVLAMEPQIGVGETVMNNPRGRIRQTLIETPPIEPGDTCCDNEARFRAIFNAATLGIVLLDLYGKITESNPAFVEMIGYPLDELVGRSLAIFSHPEDVWFDLDMQSVLTGEKSASFQAERRFVTKDGRWLRGRITASILSEASGEKQSILVFVEDVTTRWQLESELIEVQRRLMQNREMERLRLAQDLHDSLLQELYGVAFNLKDLMDSSTDHDLFERLSGLQVMLQQQIQELRMFCNELRPPTLAPFGLEKALRSYTENFRLSHPAIKVHLDLMADGQLLPEPVRLALFRIYQEMLSNIARHSGADTVVVHLRLEPDLVELEIGDNGQGFELPDRWVNLARKGHFGLVGAQERAEAIGGKMRVWSLPGEGTVINITVPVNLSADDTTSDELN